MASVYRCPECGRTYDRFTGVSDLGSYYCSNKCARAAREARGLPSSAATSSSSSRDSPFQASLIAKMQKSSGANNSGGLKLAIPIIGILIIIGLIGMAVNGIQNAFSDTKINIVSASCETQEKFVSILNKALSEVSATELEGEEFTTYGQQALDAVKKREGEHGLYKDAVYFVRLPDSVNAYIWFKTEDDLKAYVYKTK